MQRQNRISRLTSIALPLAYASLAGVACDPVVRPLGDPEAIALWEASMRDAGRDQSSAAADGEMPTSTEPPAPELAGEATPVVGGVVPGMSVGGEANAACGLDAGACLPVGDAGPPSSVCVPTGPRDCSSGLDNDCDGQPDNTLDAVCICVPGSVEPCDEHPGLDGRGQCVAGSRTCIAGEGNVTSDWGACEGAVGPAEADACTAGDDSDCNGIPNEECPCVDGDTQECGPSSNDGICQRGVSTCVNATFGECVGAVFPGARDCSSTLDNDCDGRPDNTLDNTCTCAIGSVQTCGTHPGDGNGQCRAGSQTCVGRANNSTSGFGACTGSVGPQPQDSCAEGNDGDCDGFENENCDCLNGATRRCGSTDTGSCSFGTETCVNGQFGSCQGVVNPAPRNCGSAQDNDCDGEPDNTIDNVCECSPGQGNGLCSDDPSNSRCNGQGQCVPCQADGDCSSVAGGRTTCADGECIAPAPETFDCNDPPPPAPPRPTRSVDPLGAGVVTGGVIANGRYTMREVTFFGLSTLDFAEVIDLQDGSYRRNQVAYSFATGLVASGFTEAGTYRTTDEGLLIIEGITCSLGNSERSEIWEYSVTNSRLNIFKSEQTPRRMESFEREDL